MRSVWLDMTSQLGPGQNCMATPSICTYQHHQNHSTGPKFLWFHLTKHSLIDLLWWWWAGWCSFLMMLASRWLGCDPVWMSINFHCIVQSAQRLESSEGKKRENTPCSNRQVSCNFQHISSHRCFLLTVIGWLNLTHTLLSLAQFSAMIVGAGWKLNICHFQQGVRRLSVSGRNWRW